MARRLGQALARIARGELPEGIDADAMPVPATLRASRARALIGALDRWVVRTIHAFCRRLLAQHALAAGLHPDFQVDAEERVAGAVAREVVEAALREGYDEPGDSDLLELGVEEFGPAEVEQALLVLLREGVEPEALAEVVFTPEVVARGVAALGSALAKFEAAGGGRLARVGRASTTTLGVVAAIEATAKALVHAALDVPAFDAFTEALRRDWSKDRRKRLGEWCDAGFNPTEAKALGDAAAATAAACAALSSAIEHAVALRPLRFERARRVLQPLLARAREKLRERGAIGYAALLRETRDLLRDQPAVCARVRGEFDQLLVDEFQDTDPVQCDIVRLLALTGAPDASARALPGRRPEAIDLRLARAPICAPTRPSSRDALGPDAAPRLLCVNRRSTPAILAEVERVLEPVMQGGGANDAPFQTLIAAEQRERDCARTRRRARGVELWISWVWDAGAGGPRLPTAREAAASRSAGDRARSGRAESAGRFAWSDAGVLLRTCDRSRHLPRGPARGGRALRGGGRTQLLPTPRGDRRRPRWCAACSIRTIIWR